MLVGTWGGHTLRQLSCGLWPDTQGFIQLGCKMTRDRDKLTSLGPSPMAHGKMVSPISRLSSSCFSLYCCLSPSCHAPLWKASLWLLHPLLFSPISSLQCGGCCWLPLKPSLLPAGPATIPQPLLSIRARHLIALSQRHPLQLSHVYQWLSCFTEPRTRCCWSGMAQAIGGDNEG